MTLFIPQNQDQITIRPFQYRDLDEIEQLLLTSASFDDEASGQRTNQLLQQLRRWYGVLKVFSLFPNPCQHVFNAYVAEQQGQVQGIIQVSPFNQTRSTWRVNHIAVNPSCNSTRIGSQLLRHCFETLWEARTWMLEVDVNDKTNLALYRQNGFQPLAQTTYWSVEPPLLQQLATTPPDLPNLLPVSNSDAQLLYQLDTVSMPPLLRQVFDRHVSDFKTSVLKSVWDGFKHWYSCREQVSGYVFEPQRKAAIGYFQMQLCKKGHSAHTAELTVHPAYTWLYPELLSQMAHLAQAFPKQGLRLASVDYQPEREAYLEKIGATQAEHTLLMSRSVWHKLRESKLSLDGLQLSDMLQSLQPARKPVPGRMSWLGPMNPHSGEGKGKGTDTLKGSSYNVSEFSEIDETDTFQPGSENPSEN
ncbi:MAG: GNAT family N-acetyltransferase [Microcoleaceae cyanobacterium]